MKPILIVDIASAGEVCTMHEKLVTYNTWEQLHYLVPPPLYTPNTFLIGFGQFAWVMNFDVFHAENSVSAEDSHAWSHFVHVNGIKVDRRVLLVETVVSPSCQLCHNHNYTGHTSYFDVCLYAFSVLIPSLIINHKRHYPISFSPVCHLSISDTIKVEFDVQFITDLGHPSVQTRSWGPGAVILVSLIRFRLNILE